MDDVTDQLRRYADAAARAADHRVELDAPATGRRNRPARRGWVAVAAAVAVLAGGAGVVLLGGDGDTVRTAPAGPTDGECPTPRPDGAHLGDLRIAVPWVTSADRQLATQDRLLLVLDRDGPREVQITVTDVGGPAADPGAPPGPGFAPTTVTTCDPFAGETRTELDAGVIEPHTALMFRPGGRWVVNLFADDDSEVTLEELRSLAAGMSWPAPYEPDGPCRDVGTGSLTITTLPDDFQPEAPAQPRVLSGVDESVAHHFRRSDDATIDVIWFAAHDVDGTLSSVLMGDATVPGRTFASGPAAVRGCVRDGDRWMEGTLDATVHRRTEQTVVAFGALDDGQGWAVIGSNGASEADVLEVAGGLRP